MGSQFGFFSEPQYLGPGRNRGVGKSGTAEGAVAPIAFKPAGNTNNKLKSTGFRSLFSGEPYRDLLTGGKEKKRDAGEGDEVKVAPFRPSGPMKQSVCLGDYYGTLSGPFPHIAEEPPARRKKGEVMHQSRNILTNPAKKGTYGYVGTTLSERIAGTKGLAGEYSYQADPFVDSLGKARGSNKAKFVSEVPFKPSHVGNTGLRGPGYPDRTLGKPYDYIIEGSKPVHRRPPEPEEGRPPPFKPSHPPRRGYNATLERFPKYEMDPVPLKLEKARTERLRERERTAGQASWKPSHGGKMPGPSTSIVRLNMSIGTM
ncbi:unnamed protein product [Pedinophyceae sp. YPF-701]|nr:unnamed protein product [Pedinophyceae sp. YPF-701]